MQIPFEMLLGLYLQLVFSICPPGNSIEDLFNPLIEFSQTGNQLGFFEYVSTCENPLLKCPDDKELGSIQQFHYCIHLCENFPEAFLYEFLQSPKLLSKVTLSTLLKQNNKDYSNIPLVWQYAHILDESVLNSIIRLFMDHNLDSTLITILEQHNPHVKDIRPLVVSRYCNFDTFSTLLLQSNQANLFLSLIAIKEDDDQCITFESKLLGNIKFPITATMWMLFLSKATIRFMTDAYYKLEIQENLSLNTIFTLMTAEYATTTFAVNMDTVFKHRKQPNDWVAYFKSRSVGNIPILAFLGRHKYTSISRSLFSTTWDVELMQIAISKNDEFGIALIYQNVGNPQIEQLIHSKMSNMHTSDVELYWYSYMHVLRSETVETNLSTESRLTGLIKTILKEGNVNMLRQVLVIDLGSPDEEILLRLSVEYGALDLAVHQAAQIQTKQKIAKIVHGLAHEQRFMDIMENDCVICSEKIDLSKTNLERVEITSCQHGPFHLKCLNRWDQELIAQVQTGGCPICKQQDYRKLINENF